MFDKRFISKVFCLFTLIAAIFLFPVFPSESSGVEAAWGDAGGYAGSSDYGNGSGSGGGYSGGSGYTRDDDDDDDDSHGAASWRNDREPPTYTSNYHSDYKIEDDDNVKMFLGALVVLALFGFIIYKIIYAILDSRPAKKPGKHQVSSSHRSYRRNTESIPKGAETTSSEELMGFGKLQQRDPAFHPNQLEELISNVYIQLQQAWTAGDIEPVRQYFDNRLFSQFSNQLEQLKARHRTNYVDNIAVLECRARGWYERGGEEHVVMKVRTRITDYTLDDETGKVVGGYKDKESYMEYEYLLSRTAGVKTVEADKDISAGECPNCGASINLAQSAKCEYCGCVVEAKEHSWVISEIRGVSQQIR